MDGAIWCRPNGSEHSNLHVFAVRPEMASSPVGKQLATDLNRTPTKKCDPHLVWTSPAKVAACARASLSTLS